MDPSLPTQGPLSSESEISSFEHSPQCVSAGVTRHHNTGSPSTPVGQDAPQRGGTFQQQNTGEHASNQSEPSAECFLLNEDASTKEAANNATSPARWNALGLFAICVLALGTVGIVVGMALLAHIWRSSMRAQAGHLDNGQLWDLIIRRNWTSVTVTITAAVIRVCLGFQMGIFTAMVASLLIERTGVPIGSAPLISMLRAVSTSPYNLVSRRTLTTPLAFAISLAVLLTGASNFISTALLIDFENINIITPKQTVGLLYGSSQQEDAFGVGTSTDPSGSSGIGTPRGSKIWNSQPNSYYRFAELRNDASPDIDLDQVEDSGTALRAILPFTNVANRTNLRKYEGPSVVFDSRVVCTRPNVTGMGFSTVIAKQVAGNGRIRKFDEVTITATISIPNEPSLFDSDYNPPPGGWSFSCISHAPKADEAAKYWPTSICSAKGGVRSDDSQYTRLPNFRSTVLPISASRASTFLVLNTTGPIEQWREYQKETGESREGIYIMLSDAKDWTTTEEGIWVHLQPPPGRLEAKVSISTCFTMLPGVYQDVSMSSDQDGSELSLSWDNVKDVYETASIRDQYINLGDDKASRNMRGTLDLDGKTRWELRNNMSLEDGGSQYDLSNWMIFNSVSGGLPYMNLNGVAETFEVLAGGILVPGAFSPYAVHYAHAALFQDVVKTTGKLTQGLQALFTVLRQMAYYENSPYFNHESMAVMTTSSEKLIPTQWTGFIVVAVTITAHLILLTIITVLFLGWTKASWLGNVWASLSQVVSSETEDLIDRSTDKNDEAVEKMIMAGTSVADGKLTYRVRVKRNEASGRNELSLI
ncbi:hypothetical protein GCG54_00015205 [Colletotrichum gloeosporioides]|uniref:Uncharacterized protein n=1 Tax=Colletotrichum gloeosporioides TaxID=474922 RepID=A0A8H4CDW2_COLGL|nr:uncharacterized protein GCG54_00015205 [Colletotrichum gloeosporioides]KAF3801982.1 hypothetical protein GCG54_00015205 [Colletotrichum gloeosporioides]